MSVFDTIFKMAGSIQCAAGFHTDTWEYIQADSCKQELNCARCGFQERVKHKKLSKWVYEKEGLCVQSRKCGHCTQEDFRTKHYFDSKVAISPMNCKHFKKTCGRCNHQEEEHNVMPQHDWSHWIDNPSRSNQVYRYCKQCGKRTYRDFR